VSLFLVVNHWNDFFTTQLYVTNPRLYTLQFLLYEFLAQVKNTSNAVVTGDEAVNATMNVVRATGIRLTLTVVVMLPIMLVYPFIQKFYVKGVMIGAVKG
jgi:multiple sugar transport system permease protein/putative aldouronate transport system permease protein